MKKRNEDIGFLSAEKFIDTLKNYFDEQDFTKYLRENTLTYSNIDVSIENIYKSRRKYRLAIMPFIQISENKYLIIKNIVAYSQDYCQNVYNQGIPPYTKEVDDLTKAVDKVRKRITDKYFDDIMDKMGETIPNLIFHKNKKYYEIFDYGDYDVLTFDELNNIIYNIESKYFANSMTPSELETDLEMFFKKYANKFQRRNGIIDRNIRTINQYFNTVNAKIINIMVISKMMGISVKESAYDFYCVHYEGLEGFLSHPAAVQSAIIQV